MWRKPRPTNAPRPSQGLLQNPNSSNSVGRASNFVEKGNLMVALSRWRAMLEVRRARTASTWRLGVPRRHRCRRPSHGLDQCEQGGLSLLH